MIKFFDRKSAYKDIETAINQINDGLSTVVWVEGGAGVGKTRFIEYVYSQEPTLNIFTFFTGEIFYKCECGSACSSFEYVASIIYELQRKNPRRFEIFIQNYFDCMEHISFLDACCLILPQIKSLKSVSNLIETKYKNITAKQGKISDRLVTFQLIDLFSDLLLKFLEDIYLLDKVIFCIDDVQWLDKSSLRVIEAMVRKSSFDDRNLSISLFVTIREKECLNNDEIQNYLGLYKTLSGLYPTIHTIYLENFDLATTTSVIQDTERCFLIEQIPIIYKITNGNPQELEQTLRFSDERIRNILQRNNNSSNLINSDNTFTLETVASLYYKTPVYAVLLSTMAMLRRRISISLLFQCVADVYLVLFNEICPYPDFAKAISYMESQDVISTDISGKEIALTHDSTNRIILDYISQNGDYVIYGKSIALTMLQSNRDFFLKEESQKLLALKLLYEVDARECFMQFRNIYDNKNDNLEATFYEIAAEAFCNDFLTQSQENISFAIKVILPKLVNSSSLTESFRLCHIIYPRFELCLTPGEQIIYLINYIKTQIDRSVISNSAESAITLFEKLYKYDFDNKDLYLQVLLLGMSAYEHVLEHDKILSLFKESEKLVNESATSFSNVTMCIFYRNKGLCFAHSSLKNDYFKSLIYAKDISNFQLRHLAYGTSMNNLGLSFFYNGEIDKSCRAFKISQKHLEHIGYDTARIINNIGTCYYMLKEYELAYRNFSIAASSHMEGIFMNLCIQTNLALSLYSIGQKSKAKKILDILIEEYNLGQKRSHDTLVYCAAMINRGYIAFQEEQYFQAAEYYQKSLIHTYRYQNEEQILKRTTMRDIALHLGVGINLVPNSNMDLSDNGMDFYKKPYSLVPFAFYVI